jgi:hypothetical protein
MVTETYRLAVVVSVVEELEVCPGSQILVAVAVRVLTVVLAS